MNKEEILKKASKRNRKNDEREEQISYISMGAGLVFITIYIAIIWLLDYLGGYAGSVEFNGHVTSLTDVLVSVFLLGGSVYSASRFIFTKKKSELFWAIIMFSDFILIVLNVYFGIRLF